MTAPKAQEGGKPVRFLPGNEGFGQAGGYGGKGHLKDI